MYDFSLQKQVSNERRSKGRCQKNLNMFTTHNKYEVLMDNDGILMQVVQSRKFGRKVYPNRNLKILVLLWVG